MKGRQMKRFKKCFSVSAFAVVLVVVLTAPIPTVAQAETLQELKAAAQADGLVVFRTGATETQQYRQVNDKLEKMLGIKVQLLSGSSSTLAAKEIAARRAGKPTADIWLGGPSSIVNTFVPADAVQSVQPLLVLPEVKNPKLWIGDDLPWASDWTLAYGASADSGLIVYHSKLVKPDEFKSYRDILNPKWKGKIVMRDPREDGVQSHRTFYYVKLGKEFFIKLMDEMKPAIAQDPRTAVDWVARGKYLLCIFGCQRAAEKAEAQGLPVKSELPKILKEGYPVGMGGNGLTAMKNPPHPAAAKYFINWFLSREGQIFYQKLTGNFSLRNDIPREGVDTASAIRPAEKAHQWYDWKYPGPRDESQDWVIQMMKERGYQ
jgi:iron(III) transport system substrate-binding protein